MGLATCPAVYTCLRFRTPFAQSTVSRGGDGFDRLPGNYGMHGLGGVDPVPEDEPIGSLAYERRLLRRQARMFDVDHAI